MPYHNGIFFNCIQQIIENTTVSNQIPGISPYRIMFVTHKYGVFEDLYQDNACKSRH